MPSIAKLAGKAALVITHLLASTAYAQTTELISNLEVGGAPVTITLATPTPPVPDCGSSIGSQFGFIGHQCPTTTLSTDSCTITTVASFSSPFTITEVVLDSIIATFTVTTETLAAITITKTLSLVTPSFALPTSTATGMCYYSNENLLIPCTATVIETAVLPNATTKTSAATRTIKNPITELIADFKNHLPNTYKLIHRVLYSEYPDKYIRRRSKHNPRGPPVDCLEIPTLQTPWIMTLFGMFNGVILFIYWNPVHQPGLTGRIITVSIASFIGIYLQAVYFEFFLISVRPMWKACIASWNNETVDLHICA